MYNKIHGTRSLEKIWKGKQPYDVKSSFQITIYIQNLNVLAMLSANANVLRCQITTL